MIEISFRREEGYCRICWYAASISDVDLGGKATRVIQVKITKIVADDCHHSFLKVTLVSGLDSLFLWF